MEDAPKIQSISLKEALSDVIVKMEEVDKEVTKRRKIRQATKEARALADKEREDSFNKTMARGNAMLACVPLEVEVDRIKDQIIKSVVINYFDRLDALDPKRVEFVDSTFRIIELENQITAIKTNGDL